jgi:anaerobic carbon-monoxide dehydrogenase iron sulfur subunit
MTHVMMSSKRCTGCHMCEYACSAQHEGVYRPSTARLFADVNPTTAAIKGHTCLQTGCAKCQEVCPEEAIVTKDVTVAIGGEFAGRRKLDGTFQGAVLVVDEAKCTGCGECYGVCPTGVIRAHPERNTAVKCDLCLGDPQCIAFCQNPYVLAVDIKADKADKATVLGGA